MNGDAAAFNLGTYPMPSPSKVPASVPVRNPAATRSRLMPMCTSSGRPL